MWPTSRKPSPAMIVALLALFVALGGSSYAVVTLPEHSVGPRELKSGAVTVDALRFLLGAASTTDTTPRALVKSACNGAGRPGEVITVLCPPADSLNGLFGSVPSLNVYVRRPGHLAILGTVGLDYEGPSSTHVSVAYAAALGRASSFFGIRDKVPPTALGVDRNIRSVTMLGGQQEQVPIDDLISVAAGSHTVELRARASYSSYEGRDVMVGPVTLTAVLLP